ncbi:monocarboxylate transporter 6 [Paramuricea clavata]|uniref:Monocarboxylate transporter 6 n=1 Tax=Paramuricea clavata TaxID=317549 RepID=A0A6S7GUU2_PARCT|nr:monocarboxylate transporter 6 [Paramuricea clavata]
MQKEVRYGVTLGYPLSKAKWLLIIRGLTTFVIRLIAGRFGDFALKHGKVKMVMQITFALFGVLNFMCSFLRAFPLLLVYMALIGIVEGVWWITYSILAMEITGGYYFDEAFSLLNLVGALSVLFGVPVSGWIFDHTNDFRYVFYTAFGMSLLAALMLTISSHVRVDKELSLVEKSKRHGKEEVPCELIADRNNLISESDIESITKLVYETTV